MIEKTISWQKQRRADFVEIDLSDLVSPYLGACPGLRELFSGLDEYAEKNELVYAGKLLPQDFYKECTAQAHAAFLLKLLVAQLVWYSRSEQKNRLSCHYYRAALAAKRGLIKNDDGGGDQKQQLRRLHLQVVALIFYQASAKSQDADYRQRYQSCLRDLAKDADANYHADAEEIPRFCGNVIAALDAALEAEWREVAVNLLRQLGDSLRAASDCTYSLTSATLGVVPALDVGLSEGSERAFLLHVDGGQPATSETGGNALTHRLKSVANLWPNIKGFSLFDRRRRQCASDVTDPPAKSDLAP